MSGGLSSNLINLWQLTLPTNMVNSNYWWHDDNLPKNSSDGFIKKSHKNSELTDFNVSQQRVIRVLEKQLEQPRLVTWMTSETRSCNEEQVLSDNYCSQHLLHITLSTSHTLPQSLHLNMYFLYLNFLHIYLIVNGALY